MKIHMKIQSFALTFLTVLLSVSAWSQTDLFSIEGSYQFQGEWKLLTTQVRQVIPGASSERGKAKMKELTKEGYICQLKGRNFYSCLKLTSNLFPSPEKIKTLTDTYKDSVFEFGSRNGLEIRHEGDVYKEFYVSQPVYLSLGESSEPPHRSYSSYRYSLLVDGKGKKLHKIALGKSIPSKDYLIVKDENTLVKVVKITETTKWITHVYHVKLFFHN